MFRFILILIFAVIFYFLVKNIVRRSHNHPVQSAKTKAGEDMITCDFCGVNIPRSESILSQGKLFCSDEHRRKSVKE